MAVSLLAFHLHQTVSQAVACICNARGYVVGVQNGVMRSLTEAEETEFQCAVSSHSAASPTVAATQTPSAGVSDFSYAIMIRIRVLNRWVWTTWMHFETYAEAVRFARHESCAFSVTRMEGITAANRTCLPYCHRRSTRKHVVATGR